MQFFPPFGTTPLVPSYFSLTEIDISTSSSTIEFVFSTAFPTQTPENYPFSGVVVFTNSQPNPSVDISLPDASLGAVGNQSLFLNNTSIDLVINNYGGVQVAFIPAGTSRTIILKGNSDANGEWITVWSGTVSIPDPTILAGGGLEAFYDKLNVVSNVTETATLPSTFNVIDDNSLFNYTGSSVAWTLPITPYTGFAFYLKNSTTVNGLITITPQTGYTIDGLNTPITIQPGESVFLISQNDNWFTFGRIGGDTTGVKITTDGIQVVNGSAETPSYSFINSSTTGLFLQGSNDIGFTTSGTLTASITPLALNSEVPIELNGVNLLYFTDIYP